MPELNLTRQLTKAQSIDFVNTFGTQIGQLTKLLGVERKIPMTSGSTLKTYTSSVTLDNTSVEPGAVIPLSQVVVEEGAPVEIEWDKKRKAVPAEDIQKYGYEQAITRTDKALVRELQKELRKKLFAQIEAGTGTVNGVGLQGALAQAWGGVQKAFEDDEVRTVAFINTMDAADYLGTAQITVQSAFGLNYVENFLGVDIVVITSLIDKGTLYATAADNLVLAYATVSSGELGQAFDFVTEETGLIGVTHDINKQRLTAETVTLNGMALFAERLDGVIKATIEAAPETPEV